MFLCTCCLQVWSPAARPWPTPSVSSSAACCLIRSAPAGFSPSASSWWVASTWSSPGPPLCPCSHCCGSSMASDKVVAGRPVGKCCARYYCLSPRETQIPNSGYWVVLFRAKPGLSWCLVGGCNLRDILCVFALLWQKVELSKFFAGELVRPMTLRLKSGLRRGQPATADLSSDPTSASVTDGIHFQFLANFCTVLLLVQGILCRIGTSQDVTTIWTKPNAFSYPFSLWLLRSMFKRWRINRLWHVFSVW